MNTIDFKFKYPGETEEETFEYDIPDEIIIAGVKKYIKDTFNVRIVGEDGDVWRMCFGIGKTYGDDDEFSELFDEARKAGSGKSSRTRPSRRSRTNGKPSTAA